MLYVILTTSECLLTIRLPYDCVQITCDLLISLLHLRELNTAMIASIRRPKALPQDSDTEDPSDPVQEVPDTSLSPLPPLVLPSAGTLLDFSTQGMFLLLFIDAPLLLQIP